MKNEINFAISKLKELKKIDNSKEKNSYEASVLCFKNLMRDEIIRLVEDKNFDFLEISETTENWGDSVAYVIEKKINVNSIMEFEPLSVHKKEVLIQNVSYEFAYALMLAFSGGNEEKACEYFYQMVSQKTADILDSIAQNLEDDDYYDDYSDEDELKYY